MLKISDRYQLIIGLFLVLLMVATRGHHFATLQHLPDASLAIFFLAGIYITRVWFFPLLLAVAGLLDYVAITWGGVSSFCISPAYTLLIAAYGALWFAGRKYASIHKEQWLSLIPLVIFMTVGFVLSEIISSGGFYYFSGRFADLSLTEFASRLTKYGPEMFSSLAFYVACTTVIHAVISALKLLSTRDHTSTI